VKKRSVLTLCLLVLSLSIFAVTTLSAQVLEKSPLSGGVLAARAIRSGRISFPVTKGIQNKGIKPLLTCSPAPCLLPNVDASEGGFNPVNEDPIALNPNNRNQILTGGNDYNCPGLQGFFASDDGGATWARNCLPLQSGTFGEGDPIVGYDLVNNAYAGGIQAKNSTGAGSIVVSKSTDNGKTWPTPFTAVPPFFSNGLTDKPWLEVDTNSNSPFVNSLYISVTQFSSDFNTIQITVSNSHDGGTTWKTVAVGPKNIFPDVDQFSDLAVGADGTVYVTWMHCSATGPAGDCGATTATMMFSKSSDGGTTWSTPVAMTNAGLAPDACFCAFYGSLPDSSGQTGERISNIPSVAVAPNGTLFAAMYNWTGSFMQVGVVASNDGGTSWSSLAPVDASVTHDQFFPWVNVSSNNTLGVTWLDRRNDTQNKKYQPFVTTSKDGSTFTVNRALTTVKSDPKNDGFGGFFMGDYRGHSWTGGRMYASWMDMRTNTSQDQIGGFIIHFP
jgi:hypothetical protein